jgi:general secretion pathway protein A
MEYYQYFRMKGPPFQPASPDSAVYLSPTHLEGLAILESGLTGELSGLTLLTGEAGTGKTTLIYSLLQRDYKRVRIARIDDPKLSFLEIMQLILSQMKLYSTGSTKLDYLEALDRLLDLRGKEERIAIIVDESQVLSDEVLEELRLLSNRGQQRSDRTLQLILVGQPELAERLKKPELRQLNQRISSRGMLKPLTTAQAIKYVECRLSAQGSSCSAMFAPGALKCLLRRSDGIPRKINMLCHTAMQAAYMAGERKVTYKIARKIAAEYHDSVKIKKGGLRERPALIAGVALAALLLLGFLYPRLWSNRASRRAGSSGVVAKQTVAPAKQTEPVEQAQPAERARPVEQAKAVEQTKPVEQAKAVEPSGVEAHPDSGMKPAAAAPAAPHPVELREGLAPAAAPAAPAAISPEIARPAFASEGRTGEPASAVAAVSSATRKESGAAPTSDRRRQITVKYGDTLEKLAISYLGSKSAINELVAANPQLTNINQLTVGEIINLPPGVTAKALNDRAANEASAPGANDSPAQ